MTQTKTCTGRFKGPSRKVQLGIRDLANSLCCTDDPALLADMGAAIDGCLERAYAMQGRGAYAELWTDGSYNEKAGAAGIGIVIRNGGTRTVFGKSVRASDSQEAELYAVAVGLSYLLDACPGIKSVRLRYDCVAASVNAANIDAHAGKGAPYTNLRNVMKRARKAGVTVLFQHVKSHGPGSSDNDVCDLVARHYAKARLSDGDKAMLAACLGKEAARGAAQGPRKAEKKKGGGTDG